MHVERDKSISLKRSSYVPPERKKIVVKYHFDNGISTSDTQTAQRIDPEYEARVRKAERSRMLLSVRQNELQQDLD